jgi:hypothetical protein
MRGNRNRFIGADGQAAARPARRKRQIGGGEFAAGALAVLQRRDAPLIFRFLNPFFGDADASSSERARE